MGLWSVILVCFAMAAAIGGGIYESVVLALIWRKSPPASFLAGAASFMAAEMGRCEAGS